MKLTIEHLAAYLPYEVNMTRNGFVGKLLTIKLPKETDIYDGIEFQVSCSNWWENTTDANHYKPLLRSLSDLTKEIEHNGERFVPIEWFEIGDDSNDSVEYDNGNIKLIRSLESLSKNGFANEVEYFPYGVITKLLSWHFDIYSLIPQGLAIPIKPIDNEQD